MFVGRAQLIETLRAAFRRGAVAVGDAWGIAGSGKTTLLKHAKSELAKPGDLVVRYGFELDDWEETEAEAATAADYGVFRAFAKGIADELKAAVAPEEQSREERLFANFEQALARAEPRRAASKAFGVAILSHVERSQIGVVQSDSSEISEKRRILADELAALLRAVTQETPVVSDRRVLLMLDDFEVIPRGALRSWVVKLVSELDSALVLLPRTPNFDPPDVPDLVNCELARLCASDVKELVAGCLPAHAVSDELVDAIEDATDGHPQSVCLAVELLQRQPGADVAAFVQDLGSLPKDLVQRHRAMIDKILGRDGREARSTLQACAVMRKFDAAMLEAVLGSHLDPEQLEQKYSFVERILEPRRDFFRIHPVIRAELARRLEMDDRARFIELNQRAAAFCADWISNFEEGQELDSGSLSYASWYRYEDPAWQAAKREWLYHQARATAGDGDERVRGRLRFARVFFDAFWWWGCYLDFPFCRALVKDWVKTQEDRAWTDAFTSILDAHPDGYEKEKATPHWRDGEGPRWPTVRRALQAVMRACSIDGDVEDLTDDEQRHTRALVENFLAHSFRYEAADEAAAYANALEHYDVAVALFEREDEDGTWDKWDTAWTRFERGELHREHGRTDAALADWTRAADLVVELAQSDDDEERVVDEELAANLHRLAADAHAAGNFEAAFAAHGRAVLHAYLFQGRPHPPDEYTQAFYAEQVTRALERLLEHAACVADLGAAARSLVAAFPGRIAPEPGALADLCANGDRAGLLGALFPRPPADDELNLGKGTEFADQWVTAAAEVDLLAPTDLRESAW
jgi:ABC-type hemin transport system ATPase subunit